MKIPPTMRATMRQRIRREGKSISYKRNERP
jgi:hypothetical protein